MIPMPAFLRFACLVFSTFIVFTGPAIADQASWALYKKNFMQADGRIIDTGNKDISHTEGQGWSMMLAFAHDDQAAFDKIWEWTQNNLPKNKQGLFPWKWDPNTTPHVSDQNNATDGDLMIAWSLLAASSKWNDPSYASASAEIRAAILKNLRKTIADRTLLLPGVKGFEHDDTMVFNLSYFVLPAYKDFHAVDPAAGWDKLTSDALALIQDARFGRFSLPPDWLQISDKGQLVPAPEWPPTFGYDAVRVPLFLIWGSEGGADTIMPFGGFWGQFCSGQLPPAWINLQNAAYADYAAPRGMRAVQALTLGTPNLTTAPLPSDGDYYSSALFMLAQFVRQRGANVNTPLTAAIRPDCTVDLETDEKASGKSSARSCRHGAAPVPDTSKSVAPPPC